jgi:hypothetical protein
MAAERRQRERSANEAGLTIRLPFEFDRPEVGDAVWIVLALGFGGCLALIRQSGPARPRLSS